MTKILIADGNRHMRASGYGQLARLIMLSLKRHTNYDLLVQRRVSHWDDVPNKEELCEIPEMSNRSYDIALKIGPPQTLGEYKCPIIVYTQNALSDLRAEWVEWLRPARAIIVPGQFDKIVFEKYFDNIFVCHQAVDDKTFKPIEKYRMEGPDEPSFLFVGSFGHRKGVDLLFKYFAQAFGKGRKVSLTLHCFSGLESNGVNQLLDYSKLLPHNVKLAVYNGTVSPSWMNRIYNRHDSIVTFSRGEGWCMPLHEALLCGKPVIAPNSTAMGECLPPCGVRRVDVNMLEVDSITDPFGLEIKKQYGGKNICYWEADYTDSVNALREMHENLDHYRNEAKIARKFILDNYSLASMASKLDGVIKLVN